MKKEERVKDKIIFNNIINKGNKISNKFYTLFYIQTDDEFPTFGISAPKKIGNAVTRNKLKRQLRSIIDETKREFKNNYKYIIIIRNECLNISYQEKKSKLLDLIGDINEK